MLNGMRTIARQYQSEMHPEYSRILSAAVINKGFRDQLLENPSQALSNGFNGESFQLSCEEREELSSLKGLSLADFALQLAAI